MTGNANPSWWKELADDPTKANIIKHLGFLCESPECQRILGEIADAVSKVEIAGNQYRPDEPELKLHITFDDCGEEETKILAVTVPETHDEDIPPSFAKILEIGGLHYDLFDGGFFLAPFNDEDWDDWEDWFEEYAPDLVGTTIRPVISGGSDQFIFHPTRKRPNGEPEIVWMAHDGGGYETIPQPELGPGAVFLRAVYARTVKPDSSWYI